MMRVGHRVEALGADDLAPVVSVLGEAFFDYPVMRFVLGTGEDYASRLETLLTFFVQARLLRDEVLLGVRGGGDLNAVALVSDRRARPSPPELAALRDRTWRELGSVARARYEAFGSVAARFPLKGDPIHLNMIGVRPSVRGEGLAGALLDAVHELSASSDASGVALTTEDAANVPLYEHFGYELVGSASVEGAFTTWVMVRYDR